MVRLQPDMDSQLCEAFIKFVSKFDDTNSDFLADWDSLSDYIAAWIELGDAVEKSEADWGLFMCGVAQIIGAYHEDPSILDYVPNEYFHWRSRRQRRVDQIFAPLLVWTYFMDRASWNEAAADIQRKRCQPRDP